MLIEIDTKRCTKCGEVKNISNFSKCSKVKSGLKAECKECEKIYRLKHQEKHKQYMKKYYQDNKELIQQKHKKYNEEHKEEKRLNNRLYRIKNRKILNEKNKQRRLQDPVYDFKCKVREVIKNVFRRKTIKSNSIEILCGCDAIKLKQYLISTFEKNYKVKWNEDYIKLVHVDHIVPLATANTIEEVKKLCHYTNLQLLKVEDNLEKKNKIGWSLKNE